MRKRAEPARKRDLLTPPKTSQKMEVIINITGMWSSMTDKSTLSSNSARRLSSISVALAQSSPLLRLINCKKGLDDDQIEKDLSEDTTVSEVVNNYKIRKIWSVSS